MSTMAEALSEAIAGIFAPAGHGDGVLVSLAVEAGEPCTGWADEPYEIVDLGVRWCVRHGAGEGTGFAPIAALVRDEGSEATWRDDEVVRKVVLCGVRDALEAEGVCGIDIAVALIKTAETDLNLLHSLG